MVPEADRVLEIPAEVPEASGSDPAGGFGGKYRHSGAHNGCTSHHLPDSSFSPPLFINPDAICASLAARMAFSSLAVFPRLR